MKWTNQRKAFVAILALAGGAFVVDRYILGYEGVDLAGPSAETLLVKSDASSPKSSSQPLIRANNVPSIADRVAALAKATPAAEATGDAFTVPEHWRKLVEKAVVKAPEPKPAPASAAPTFRLSMIIDGQSQMAVINAKRIALGQTIEGYTLTEITPTVPGRAGQAGRPGSVALEGPTGRIVVPLNVQPGSEKSAVANASGGES